MNLQMLFDIFAKEMADNEGLVSMTKTAVHHFAKAFGVASASDIPVSALANAPERLADHLKEQGSGKFKIRNNKYCLKRLIHWCRDRGVVSTRTSAELSETWRTTIEACVHICGRRGGSGWHPLGRWSSSVGLGPTDLTSNDLAEFMRWLQTESGFKGWRRMYYSLEKTWGRAVLERKVPRLNFPPLPRKWSVYRLPLEEWPIQMQQEYQKYRKWTTDKFVYGRPRRNKQREGTARGNLRHLERIAGYFVNIQGIEKEKLTFDMFLDKMLITSFLSWLSSQRGASDIALFHSVSHLISIGLSYCKLTKEELTWLGELKEELQRAKPEDKSHKMVSLKELQSLPTRLRHDRMHLDQVSKGRRKKVSQKRWAMMVRNEFLIRFMIATVLRSRNVREARLGRNVFQTSDGSWKILFDGDETKTGNKLSFSLLPDFDPYLEEYLDQARPILTCDGNSDLLFTSVRGRPLTGPVLGDIIRNASLKYLGKPVHPHLIRDIVATDLLIETGDYLMVSKLLGHESLDTTLKIYGHYQTADAMRTYHKLLHSTFDSSDLLAEKHEQAQAESSPESAQAAHRPKHPEKKTHEAPESTPLDRRVHEKGRGFPTDGRTSKPSAQAKRADRPGRSRAQKRPQNRQPPKAGNIPLRPKHRTRKIHKKTLGGQLSLFS